jgi:hypothetical protein
MTEEIASTPGWVDERLDEIFASAPDNPAVREARQAYAACLANRKAPAAPSDMLGAEFNPCRAALRRALHAADAGLDVAALEPKLEALEAEIANDG